MPAGRPAKPTSLKVLHGDRKDRINTAEPKPATEGIEPPAGLSREARKNWDRLAPDRIAKGVLTVWDVEAFAAFCEALVTLRTAHKEPVTVWMKVVNICSTLGGRFGWTPADRAKLSVGGGDDGKSAGRLIS